MTASESKPEPMATPETTAVLDPKSGPMALPETRLEPMAARKPRMDSAVRLDPRPEPRSVPVFNSEPTYVPESKSRSGSAGIYESK